MDRYHHLSNKSNQNGIHLGKRNSEKKEIDEIKENLQSLEAKLDVILMRQDEIAKILGEHNVLFRRNLGVFSYPTKHFPINTEEELQRIENELEGDNKPEIVNHLQSFTKVAITKQLLAGSLSNIERILGKNLVQDFNYDGSKGKKSFRDYPLFISVLFETTQKDDGTHASFLKDLRKTFGKLKNRYQKQDQNKSKQLKRFF